MRYPKHVPLSSVFIAVNLRNIKRAKLMRLATKILTLAVITGTTALISTSASAWWSSDNDDYWGGGPWGYPGYGGWGGYPGYGGWGGYPGYGGWQQSPRVIYTQPPESGSSQQYRIE
jgi:hypothetical protein